MNNMNNMNNSFENSKFLIKTKRKKWISEDSTICNNEIKNIFNVVKYLESLPIKKYTKKIISNIETHRNNKKIKYTKKQNS